MTMGKPRLLDLFCGAGGATKGYQRAGFYVVGVDIKPQPHYCGDEFYQADAMTFPLDGFDAYHASPPCQDYSVCQNYTKKEYPRLIASIRERLIATSKIYVIENVYGAKAELINPIMLCGTMFGLKVIRHRLFECNPPLYFPPAICAHEYKVVKQGYAAKPNQYHSVTGHCAGVEGNRKAMGIDWMTQSELSEAIPPAYTEFIGKQMICNLEK